MTLTGGDTSTSLLARELTGAVRGPVRFDDATRAMWSADSSNYRHVPLGVVQPLDADDAAATVAVARAHGVPVLPLGARTSICGQSVNEAVVIDFHRHMHRVLDVDPGSRTARVEPGTILDDLREAGRPHRLTFGPDPSTHNRCTLGGMIGNNARGSHSVAWGKTVDNVRSLDVLLPDGTRMEVGPTTDLDAAMRRPGPRVASTATSSRCATGWTRSCAPTPPSSPAACRATTSTSSCPSTASTSPVRSSAPRAPARRSSAPRSRSWSPRRRAPSRSSASPTPTPRPTTSSPSASTRPSPSRAWTRASSGRCAPHARTRPRTGSSRAAPAGSTSRPAATPARRPTRRPRRSPPRCRGPPSTTPWSPTRGRCGRSGRSARTERGS